MNDLVILKSFVDCEQAFTTSLKVAEIFEKEHFHVIRDIEEIVRKLTEDAASAIENPKLVFLKISEMFHKSNYKVEGQTRRYPMYYLNRDGFTLLAMGFTGQKALEFKLAYIAEFNRMEKILAERQTAEWKAARQAVKDATRKMTDAIRDKLIPLAIKQGMDPEKAQFFYNNYNRLLNKYLGVKSDNRELLSQRQLFEMEKMSAIAAARIEKCVAEEMEYHAIYADVKAYFAEYARISMF